VNPAVIVGAGPAGLAAALELRRRGAGEVVVLERAHEAGGIPRHAHHQGFGLRDLRRVLAGPRYARRYRELARRAGAEVLAETMVTGWSADGALELTSPRGREALAPSVVILATGCRERPRSARLVPGSRPDGVMTTGMLQQLVYLHGLPVGRRALIVGAEHVSFSAIATLAHGGARAVGMTTELPRHQSLELFRWGAAVCFRTPLWTRTAVTAVNGRPRVEEVELTDLDTGATRGVACDTVVFTADWIPDNELAIMAGVELDAGTLGPAVDAALRTSCPGVFAAGNLLHGAETADVAATRPPWPRTSWPPAALAERALGRPAPAAGPRRACRSSASARSTGSCPTRSPPAAKRRRAAVSCCARASSCEPRGSRSPRTDAGSGRAGCRGSSPGAPVGSRTAGRERSTPAAGPCWWR
jgi:thioredoxin reductase